MVEEEEEEEEVKSRIKGETNEQGGDWRGGGEHPIRKFSNYQV